MEQSRLVAGRAVLACGEDAIGSFIGFHLSLVAAWIFVQGKLSFLVVRMSKVWCTIKYRYMYETL